VFDLAPPLVTGWIVDTVSGRPPFIVEDVVDTDDATPSGSLMVAFYLAALVMVIHVVCIACILCIQHVTLKSACHFKVSMSL
jgi:cytochrome bd-type quinol oxidase subunit 1